MSEDLPESKCNKVFESITTSLSIFDYAKLLYKFEVERDAFVKRDPKTSCNILPKWLFHSDNDVANQYHDTGNELVIYKRDGGYCVYCGMNLRQGLRSIDHIYPVSRFKSAEASNFERYKNSYLNVVASCTYCNSMKSDFFPQLNGRDHVGLSRKQCIRSIRKQISEKLHTQKCFKYQFKIPPAKSLIAWIPDIDGTRWLPSNLDENHRRLRTISDYRVS
jgi:hypothetical protein